MGDTSEMSFWDHLDVLRGVLLRSAAAIVVLTAIFLCFKDALFSAVLWPASEDFVLYRLLGVRFSMDLINIEVSAQFFAHLRMAALSGVVLAFPYIIFELWKFIAPALYEKEKKAMDELKAKGKEKTATYRQYMGNRLMYGRILDLYKQYDLLRE